MRLVWHAQEDALAAGALVLLAQALLQARIVL